MTARAYDLGGPSSAEIVNKSVSDRVHGGIRKGHNGNVWQ